MDFKNAIRESDGDRILSIWKNLMLLFKASGRKKLGNRSINPFESILHTFTTQSCRTTEEVSLCKLSWTSWTQHKL